MSIKIFYDDIGFRLKGWRNVKKLIDKVISEEGKVSGDLNFIMTDDEALKKINVQFLKHNYFTDVISFDYSTEGEICGEIYISLDRVKINSINYDVSFRQELLRVIIHGVLHLCGYDDKTDPDRKVMREREDFWLNFSKID